MYPDLNLSWKLQKYKDDTMKTKNILPQKLPKININKKNILQASKILMGLLALGVCLKVGYSCAQRSRQQKKEIAPHDRTTMATLIDKKIIKDKDNKNRVIFWLDTNNDRKTAEGYCSMPDADNEQTLNISNLTNGTTRSLAEWQKMVHPYEVHHCPSEFPTTRQETSSCSR